MRLVDWAKEQGITYRTAWNWFREGKLPVPAYKTPSGAILIGSPTHKAEAASTGETWIYARVSSHDAGRRGDLDRQVERCSAFCGARGWVVSGVVREVASGMNDSRPKLGKLIDRRPARIVVEHKDRLTRFGFGYFERMLPMLGCDLVVMNRNGVEKDDLMKDLVSVITSFCCRLYGMRRGHAVSGKVRAGVLGTSPDTPGTTDTTDTADDQVASVEELE